MKLQWGWLCLLLASAATTSSFAFAANNHHASFVRGLERGGGTRSAINVDSSSSDAAGSSGKDDIQAESSENPIETSLSPKVGTNSCDDKSLYPLFALPHLYLLTICTNHIDHATETTSEGFVLVIGYRRRASSFC